MYSYQNPDSHLNIKIQTNTNIQPAVCCDGNFLNICVTNVIKKQHKVVI